MKQTGFQQSFNVGEIAPDAWSRSELAHYSKGCRLGYNMIGRVPGPMGRRPGTWFCGYPKNHNRAARLVPFRRNSADALVLEFGHNYVRVWTVNGTPLMSGGSQVEFTSTYADTVLPHLHFRQSGDVIFITRRDGGSPRILRRLSNTSWAFEGLSIINGPFRTENGDPDHTLALNGNTLTASKSTFNADHVGGLFRLRMSDGNPSVKSWEPEETGLSVNDLRLSNGRVYRLVSGIGAGNTPPVHTRGTAFDGAATWEYWHDGAVNLYVTAYTNAQQVTVQPMGHAPSGLESGTSAWSESAWSDYRGWPTSNPVIREERMAMAGAAAEPDMIDFTRTAGFNSRELDYYAGLGTGRVVDDDSVRRIVGGDRERIVWMASSAVMVVGTTDGEYVVSGATLDDPISPSGCVARPMSEFGSADVAPVLAYGAILHVAAGGQTLREFRYVPEQGYGGQDLSVLADHIGKRGLAELTWLKQPLNLIWVRLADGGQASMTYHAEQRVFGWNRHGIAATGVPTEDDPLGGGLVLESSCVIPGLAGRPRLFMLMRRQKANTVQRLIVRMADPEDNLFLDLAERYSGAGTNSFGSVEHLAGETVTIMAATEPDAKPVPGRGWGEYRERPVNNAGEVALPPDETATAAYIGLPYLSRWEGLPPEMAGPGSTAARKVRYTKMEVIADLAIAEVGSTGEEGDSSTDRLMSRQPGDVAGPVMRRFTQSSAVTGNTEPERRLFMQTDHGWDMVIHVVRGIADVH